MKIALVSPYDFAFPGGVANHILALERCFTSMGHDVRVIAPASRPVTGLGDRFIALGKPQPIPSSGSIARISVSVNLTHRIKAMLDGEDFDIIHLHEPFCPTLCTGVLRFSNTVNIGTFHASRARSYTYWKPYVTIFLKRRSSKLRGRIAVSGSARDCANKHFPGDYTIIPNGVDLEYFSPEVAPVGELCDGKLNILFVGRLEKRKGFDYLLDAYQQVKRKIPDSRLIVVGPGTRLRHGYEKRVRSESLEDVVFAGYVPQDELPRYYRTADIFCAPATGRESFGIVLLEAMAVGKPVVASNIEGYASVLDDGVEGLLVPPKDSGALAQALLLLARDPQLRQQMGARGRAKALGYSWQNIARRVLDYYRQVLSESGLRQITKASSPV